MGGSTPLIVFGSCQIICYMLSVLLFITLAGLFTDCVALMVGCEMPLAAAAEVAVRDLVPYCVVWAQQGSQLVPQGFAKDVILSACRPVHWST